MAKMGIRNKISFGVVVLFLFAASSLAFNPDEGVEDLSEYEQTQLAQIYDAFQSGDTFSGLVLVTQNPQFMERPDIAAAVENAMKTEPHLTASVLNRPEASAIMEDYPGVLEAFGQAAQEDVDLLNENPEARRIFLEVKHDLGVDDKSVVPGAAVDPGFIVTAYSGEKISIADPDSSLDTTTTFSADDFPGGKIEEVDEQVSLIHQDTSFFGTEDLSREEEQCEGDEEEECSTLPVYQMNGGIASIGKEVGAFNAQVQNGLVVGYFSNGNVAGYAGNFGYEQRSEDGTKRETVSGDFQRFTKLAGSQEIYSSLNIRGKIIHDSSFADESFIVVGDAEMKRDDGTTFKIQSPSGREVYYTENGATNFCQEGHTCILDFGEVSSNHKQRLSFFNVQEGELIEVQSPTYYDNIGVVNQVGGEVTFVSLDGNGKAISEINTLAGQEPKIRGVLAESKGGRVDILANADPQCSGESCEKVLFHWSSDKNQKIGYDYFNKPREHFVSCNPSLDCERVFAEAFGRVILPSDGSKPKSLIIIAGDGVHSAQSLQSRCQKEGCYIVNSRDVPPTTTAENLYLTGHHYPGTAYLWKDQKTVNRLEGDSHLPIDKLYFSVDPTGGEKHFNVLPEGNVKRVIFSSCNTALETEEIVLQTLEKKYPDLEMVQGWSGKAPLDETIEADTLSTLKPLGNNLGERAWYVKVGKDDRGIKQWAWTDGVECKILATGDSCNLAATYDLSLLNPRLVTGS